MAAGAHPGTSTPAAAPTTRAEPAVVEVPFVTWSDVEYGVLADVSPLVRRIVAHNPGKFTYTGTGTYVVGRGSVAVIDPGPDDEAHVDALLAALAGETVSHIVITHTHRDHSPASRAVAAATSAPVVGFGPHPPEDLRPDAGDEEPGDMDFRPDHVLRDGDVVDGRGWTLEAIHTPGHISNHLCFALPEEQALFTGDHVMGWSTTVIPPPDGNMTDYLASLVLLFDRDDAVHWPTHGPPIHRPEPHVRALHAHRLDREAQILAQLAGGPATIPELVAALYADVDPRLHEPAGRSVLAHLIRLEDAGRVASEPTGIHPEADAPGADDDRTVYRLSA